MHACIMRTPLNIRDGDIRFMTSEVSRKLSIGIGRCISFPAEEQLLALQAGKELRSVHTNWDSVGTCYRVQQLKMVSEAGSWLAGMAASLPRGPGCQPATTYGWLLYTAVKFS